MKSKKKQKRLIEEISLERMYRLFELAEKEFAKHPERSNRYVEIARKIGMRNRVRIPLELKYRFCKKCRSFLKKGQNAELKQMDKWITIECSNCGAQFKRKKAL